tara:strand:+ start:376 stop:903 length:528 start_codon:yes stop_codon:yes gene_type:complete
LSIKKIDISSILPIIINNIKLIFEDVNRFIKFIFCILYISEFTVFVRVNIDNLNDFSKSILSTIRRLDKINKLKKKDINIKNDIFTFSSVIFLSELKIVLFTILFGLISFIISEAVIFNKIYILVNLIPDVFEINDPPIIVINKKYKFKLLSDFIRVKPELDKLLTTLMIISRPS